MQDAAAASYYSPTLQNEVTVMENPSSSRNRGENDSDSGDLFIIPHEDAGIKKRLLFTDNSGIDGSGVAKTAAPNDDDDVVVLMEKKVAPVKLILTRFDEETTVTSTIQDPNAGVGSSNEMTDGSVSVAKPETPIKRRLRPRKERKVYSNDWVIEENKMGNSPKPSNNESRATRKFDFSQNSDQKTNQNIGDGEGSTKKRVNGGKGKTPKKNSTVKKKMNTRNKTVDTGDTVSRNDVEMESKEDGGDNAVVVVQADDAREKQRKSDIQFHTDAPIESSSSKSRVTRSAAKKKASTSEEPTVDSSRPPTPTPTPAPAPIPISEIGPKKPKMNETKVENGVDGTDESSGEETRRLRGMPPLTTTPDRQSQQSPPVPVPTVVPMEEQQQPKCAPIILNINHASDFARHLSSVVCPPGSAPPAHFAVDGISAFNENLNTIINELVCPICDRHMHNSQASYVLIRFPTCGQCCFNIDVADKDTGQSNTSKTT